MVIFDRWCCHQVLAEVSMKLHIIRGVVFLKRFILEDHRLCIIETKISSLLYIGCGVSIMLKCPMPRMSAVEYPFSTYMYTCTVYKISMRSGAGYANKKATIADQEKWCIYCTVSNQKAYQHEKNSLFSSQYNGPHRKK
jgi:uncharacterized membrane protein SirB2